MTDKDTAAKKKTARRQLGVECLMDIGVPAVFYCSRCKKPFCEDCIGREEAKKTFCIHCAGVEETVEEEAQRILNRTAVKKKSFLLTVFPFIAIIAISANAYILVNDQLESEQAEAPKSDVSPQLKGITKCRANLEILVAEASAYSKVIGHPPSSLEELSKMLQPQVETKDPISFMPYIIKSDAMGKVTAHCPTPGVHGVAAVIAVPGKPARLIYQGDQL